MNYPTPTPEEFRSAGSESAKYRHLTVPYLTGFGVDVASQGDAVTPTCASFDLPIDEFLVYSNGDPPKGHIHFHGHADKLPFEDKSLDWLYSSHLLEDFYDWLPVLSEWDRVVRVGGRIIILLPDKVLWNKALELGQLPNCSHRHESYPGELTEVFTKHFGHYRILEDRLTAVVPSDYSILFVAERIR